MSSICLPLFLFLAPYILFALLFLLFRLPFLSRFRLIPIYIHNGYDCIQLLFKSSIVGVIFEDYEIRSSESNNAETHTKPLWDCNFFLSLWIYVLE